MLDLLGSLVGAKLNWSQVNECRRMTAEIKVKVTTEGKKTLLNC